MQQTPRPIEHEGSRGRFGVGRVEITPPVGIYARNWGAAEHDCAESIHRPLTLTVLTIRGEDHGGPIILACADLGWWRSSQLFDGFRSRVLGQLEVPAERFLFALSHTHSGPALVPPDPGLPGCDLIRPWFDSLVAATVEAARLAQSKQFKGHLEWHTGHCRLATNRDLPDPEAGSNRYLCGYNAEGVADDRVSIGRITDEGLATRATLVHYACHPTTLAWQNRAISPDYVGAMREVVERETNAPVLFLQGASGDLAPRRQYSGDPEVADQNGRQLGYSALATISDMDPPARRLTYRGAVESGAPLAVWQPTERTFSKAVMSIGHAVRLPLKDWPTAAELEKQRRECSDRALAERLRRKRDVRLTVGDEPTFELPLWGLRLGNSAIVGCRCEAYSCAQRELSRRCSGRRVLWINLLNGSLGYLPPQNLYDENIYAVWQTPFARGSLERTIDAMVELVERLFDGHGLES